MVIECGPYWNPLYPNQNYDQGITLSIQDLQLNDVCLTSGDTAFKLDSTYYKFARIPPQNVQISQENKVVQVVTKYTYNLVSPIKFELTGCFVKFSFPKQYPKFNDETDFKTIEGSNMLLNEDGTSTKQIKS